jgi:hypothetical protein
MPPHANVISSMPENLRGLTATESLLFSRGRTHAYAQVRVTTIILMGEMYTCVAHDEIEGDPASLFWIKKNDTLLWTHSASRSI